MTVIFANNNDSIMDKVWNKQSEKDLFNEQVDYTSTYYAVIMKDLTEKVVVSYADEGYDGTRNVYYDFVGDDDKVVDFDEILLWREIANMNEQLNKRIQEQKEFLRRFYDRIFAPIKI